VSDQLQADLAAARAGAVDDDRSAIDQLKAELVKATAERDRFMDLLQREPMLFARETIHLLRQTRDKLQAEVSAVTTERDAAIVERDSFARQFTEIDLELGDLKFELKILRGVEPLPFRDLATLDGQARIIRATRAERDQLKAELTAVIGERDQYRRDFISTSDRAAELAARVSEVETERDRLAARIGGAT